MESAMKADKPATDTQIPENYLDYRNDSTVSKIQKYDFNKKFSWIFYLNYLFFQLQNCDQQDVKRSKVQNHGWMQWYAKLST